MGGQFDHFYLPHDQQEDWVRGPNRELILCIPSEYCPYVQHPPMIHRLGAARLTIDWTDAVHGKDWTKCYIGPQ